MSPELDLNFKSSCCVTSGKLFSLSEHQLAWPSNERNLEKSLRETGGL